MGVGAVVGMGVGIGVGGVGAGVGKGVGVTLPKFYRIATNRFASNTHLRSSRA